jgi:hypothetical protein
VRAHVSLDLSAAGSRLVVQPLSHFILRGRDLFLTLLFLASSSCDLDIPVVASIMFSTLWCIIGQSPTQKIPGQAGLGHAIRPTFSAQRLGRDGFDIGIWQDTTGADPRPARIFLSSGLDEA